MENSGNNNKISGNIFSSNYKFSAANPFDNGFKPNDTSNPFETKPANQPENQAAPTSNPIKRLNGYDSTILNNTKFDDKNAEEVNIEYRIKDKEATINDLNEKIKMADTYGTQNEALGLKAKRQRLMQELSALRKEQMYGGRVLGEKRFHHQHFKKNMPVIYKVQEFISRQIMARVSKKVNSVVTLSDSLDKLSEISKSVDELIDMNVPYGEKKQNYEKLTEYLNQANLIHSKISKSLGKKI